MFLNFTVSQVKLLMRKRAAWISFTVILLFVLINYMIHVFEFQGYDVLDMYHPVRLLLLAEDSGSTGFYFMQLYPILVVLPAGFAFADDKASAEMVFLIAKVGKVRYYFGKLLAVFFCTFLIFLVPMLLEYGLVLLSFPQNAVGDFSGAGMYDKTYMENVFRYPQCELFISYPFRYPLFFLPFFSALSGILAMFVSVLAWGPIRFKVILLLPLYLISNLFLYAGMVCSDLDVSTNYFSYFQMCATGEKNMTAFLLLMALFLMASLMITWIQCRKDCLR